MLWPAQTLHRHLFENGPPKLLGQYIRFFTADVHAEYSIGQWATTVGKLSVIQTCAEILVQTFLVKLSSAQPSM